ncbi:hypothetical protein Trydic_g22832 [Trypoxylus dichotomus]
MGSSDPFRGLLPHAGYTAKSEKSPGVSGQTVGGSKPPEEDLVETDRFSEPVEPAKSKKDIFKGLSRLFKKPKTGAASKSGKREQKEITENLQTQVDPSLRGDGSRRIRGNEDAQLGGVDPSTVCAQLETQMSLARLEEFR